MTTSHETSSQNHINST